MGVSVALGQVKGFDLFEQDDLFAILRESGFPQSFLKLFRETYAGLSSTLMSNAFLSSDAPVGRGAYICICFEVMPLTFSLATELRKHSSYVIW